MKTLLLGMGNPILTDDAVGVRLARQIGEDLRGAPDLTVVEECSVGGMNLLDVLEGYDRAIVLDSLDTRDGVPGAWHRFGMEALNATVHVPNIHDVNFATALELGRRLGIHLPEDIHIFAVEVEDNRTFSERMTPALEESVPTFASAIRREVESILRG
jgi:hydrogenase maturation protease